MHFNNYHHIQTCTCAINNMRMQSFNTQQNTITYFLLGINWAILPVCLSACLPVCLSYLSLLSTKFGYIHFRCTMHARHHGAGLRARLSVRLSVCLSVRPSVHPIHLFIYLRYLVFTLKATDSLLRENDEMPATKVKSALETRHNRLIAVRLGVKN